MRKTTVKRLAALYAAVMLGTTVFPGTGFSIKAAAYNPDKVLFSSSLKRLISTISLTSL